MPKLPPRECTSPRCHNKQVKRGRCEEHQPNGGWKERPKTNEVTALPGSRQWERIRQRIFIRDNYLCQPCLNIGKLRQGTEIDHITPRAEGGGNEDDNLQVICTDCHMAKTKEEARKGSTVRRRNSK